MKSKNKEKISTFSFKIKFLNRCEGYYHCIIDDQKQSWRYSIKKAFLKISLNTQENTRAGIYF